MPRGAASRSHGIDPGPAAAPPFLWQTNRHGGPNPIFPASLAALYRRVTPPGVSRPFLRPVPTTGDMAVAGRVAVSKRRPYIGATKRIM